MHASTPASAITYGTHISITRVKSPVNLLRPHSARGMTHRYEGEGRVRCGGEALRPPQQFKPWLPPGREV